MQLPLECFTVLQREHLMRRSVAPSIVAEAVTLGFRYYVKLVPADHP